MHRQGYRPNTQRKRRASAPAKPPDAMQRPRRTDYPIGYVPPSPHSPSQQQTSQSAPIDNRFSPGYGPSNMQEPPIYHPLLSERQPPPVQRAQKQPPQRVRNHVEQVLPPIAPMQQFGGPQKPGKKHAFNWAALILIVVLAGALSAGGYYIYVSSQVTPYDATFAHGIYIDGINMGGLTGEEGVQLIREQAQQRQSAWNVSLMYRGQQVYTITADMLGMEIKIDEVLTTAWQLGRAGNVFERKASRDRIRSENHQFFTVVPSANTAVIDSILDEIKTSVYREPSDARILQFDPSAEEPFTYQEEVIGRVLDTGPLKEHLYAMVSAMETGNIEIEPTDVMPNVFLSDLKAKTSLRATAITVVSKDSTENRTNNIRVAFDKMNGKVLNANQSFSFNATAGARTVKNGYYEAIEYAYGTEQMGIGGGVCQASTTVYLAALKAGLQIVKREPHSDRVSYTDYGQDATVSSEKGHEIDFVFKNNTSDAIYIASDVLQDPSNKRQYLSRVRIYGPQMGDVFYKVQSETVQKLPVPEKPIYDKDITQEHVTYRDETKLRRRGKEGYIVETYLITLNGNTEVARELINRDTYPAKADRYWVGTKKR